MNKLLFTYTRDWGVDIILTSNNHNDLADYLNEYYDWFRMTVGEEAVMIKETESSNMSSASLKWIKHV